MYSFAFNLTLSCSCVLPITKEIYPVKNSVNTILVECKGRSNLILYIVSTINNIRTSLLITCIMFENLDKMKLVSL